MFPVRFRLDVSTSGSPDRPALDPTSMRALIADLFGEVEAVDSSPPPALVEALFLDLVEDDEQPADEALAFIEVCRAQGFLPR